MGDSESTLQNRDGITGQEFLERTHSEVLVRKVDMDDQPRFRESSFVNRARFSQNNDQLEITFAAGMVHLGDWNCDIEGSTVEETGDKIKVTGYTNGVETSVTLYRGR